MTVSQDPVVKNRSQSYSEARPIEAWLTLRGHFDHADIVGATNIATAAKVAWREVAEKRLTAAAYIAANSTCNALDTVLVVKHLGGVGACLTVVYLSTCGECKAIGHLAQLAAHFVKALIFRPISGQ